MSANPIIKRTSRTYQPIIRWDLHCDISGRKFGRLTTLECLGRHKRSTYYRCACDCGEIFDCTGSSLTSGHSKSCGCKHWRHRDSGSKRAEEYSIWVNMRRRCTDPKLRNYPWYGGRGIYVCSRWESGEGNLGGYECFLQDMGRRPSKKHTLERRQNDGPYSPENCVWATQKQQARNKSANVRVEAFGRTMVLAEWAEEFGLPQGVLWSRLKRGWPPERAISLPRQKQEPFKVEIEGVVRTTSEWAEVSGIPRHHIYNRVKLGWPPSDLLKPVGHKRSKPL